MTLNLPGRSQLIGVSALARRPLTLTRLRCMAGPPIGSVTLATSSLSSPLHCSVAPPEAERRDKIRGQIVDSSKRGVRIEHSDFKGEHVVECYVVKDGVVVARDRIDVPVSNTSVKTANVL
ncbi:nucleotide-binding domain-containing protein [Streptomyces sp. NPDC001273]|uniref:nucleotide-binding domain-containing protein n=2 Tax=Streptomyces TaxID=1883 RepID=UPI0033D32874